MTIKDLKEWVNYLPEYMNGFNVVYRSVSDIPGDIEDSHVLYKDLPLTAMDIDECDKEACLFDEISYSRTL